MPQIIRVTSEAIQAQIRRLLPSQQGFGIDIEASSVITPIIDVTPAAEGSQLPQTLQQALAFGSSTNVYAAGTSVDYNLTPGFYRLNLVSTVRASSANDRANYVRLEDGASAVSVWVHRTRSGGINGEYVCETFNDIIYLNQGDFLNLLSETGCNIGGSVRQVADVYGNLINPSGFTFE